MRAAHIPWDIMSLDRAWITVSALFGMAAANALLKAFLPKGWHFRMMDRWLRRNDPPDDPPDDEDDWTGQGW